MPGEEALSLSTLPLETLLDDILPNLPARDLLKLAQCNKFFATLCDDNTLWKHKLEQDYNFSGDGTARTSGWKFIYRGMYNPRVYVWGEKSSGRLGLQPIPQSNTAGVPYPVQLHMPGVRIVNIVAGGMSFHALDSNGNIHVWGTLNGQMFASERQGFSNSGRRATVPHQLSLPFAIRSISCGRLHSSCLDRNNSIWTFTNWGRPFKLASAILQDAEFSPKQVECGWAFSSFLTKSGDVFVWWPSDGRMGEIAARKMQEMDAQGNKVQATANHVIPCIPWDMEEMPTRLPHISSLPGQPDTGDTSQSNDTQLIQIAALDQHIIGLTNRGHVLKFGGLHNESGAANGRWEYLPNFSELRKVREQPAFLESEEGKSITAPPTMKITHITANFEHFVAYSTGASSIVLIGDVNTTSVSQPKIIPELQNRSVISVVVGDYHNAAVTADGKLLTWGNFSHGALGLGDPVDLEPGTPGGFATERDRAFAARSRRGEPPGVNVPTEVRFDHQSKSARKRYCVSATAAGWHTGALVIDLEPGSEDEDEENDAVNTEPVDAVSPNPPTLPPHSWETPPIIPLPGIFRVGFAGRGGLTRGRGGPPLRHTQPRPPNEGATE